MNLAARLLSGGAPAAEHNTENVCVDVSYGNRVDNVEGFNFCLVPDGGADAVFFAGMGIIAMSVASPRWDALVVLALGAIYEVFAFQFNLGHFSNASALWLGMRPADIFVYVFLPPFLLDLSVRIDYYLFKKVLVNILYMAFVMVIVSTLVFIPFMLYGLNLEATGWTASYVALFGAVIGSTDAAAVSAALNAGGGPEILAILLEGESMFNDASSLTLFEIFKELIEEDASHPLGQTIEQVVVGTIKASVIGTAVGLAVGIFNQIIFIWLQWRNMPSHAEVAFTVGGCYVSFYIAQVWCKASGCVGTVAYGLYGASTLLFGMSMKARASKIFVRFWDVLIFIINGLIFFYVGASCVNFTWRSSEDLYQDRGLKELFATIWYKLPLIWLVSFGMRGFMLYIGFKVLFYLRLTSENFSWQQVTFVTIGGLRGSLSLVLASATFFIESPNPDAAHVRAEIAIYTAGFVIMTLMINGPLAGPLMTLLKLDAVSPELIIMRRQVKGSLRQFTSSALEAMKAEQDENEMLQGVDWEVVSLQTDHTTELDKFLRESSPTLGIKNFINAYSCNWISACCSSNSSLKKKKKAKSSSAGFDDDDDPENMSAPELETIARGSVNYERRGSLKQPLTAVSGPNFGEAGGVKGAGTTGIVVFREEELVVDPQQRQHAKKKSPGLKTIQSIARSRSHRHLGDPIPAKSSVFARMKNHLGGKGKSAEVESKATIKSGDLEGKAIAYHKQGSLRRGRKSSNTNAVLGRQSDGGAAGTDASVRPSLRQKSVLVAAMPRYPAGEQSEAALLSPSAAHASAEDTAEHGAANGANVSANVTLEMAPLGNGAENGTGTTRPPGPVGEGTEGTDSAGPVKSPTKKHKKTAAVNPAAGMVLTHGKDGTIGHVDVGARSLAKSSQRMVGDRPVGRDSQRSTGDRPMGRDSQRMIGDRPVGRGSVSNIPQGPAGGSNMSYVFESPPGHEMDGISGASSVPRSLGTRSVSNTVARTSNLAPRPYSPPGHEMDGMTRHGSIGFVFESPAGHEGDGLSGRTFAPSSSSRANRPLGSQSVNINLAYSGRERPIGRASTTNPALASASAALRADMSDSGRGLNRGSTEQRTLGAGQMSLAAERALAAMDANARNNTGGDRPIGRASVSNLSPAGGRQSERPLGTRSIGGNFSDRTLATTSQRPAGSDSVNLKKYGAPPTLTVGPGGGLIRRSTNKSSSSISGKEVLDAESSMKAVIKEETHYQYGVDGVMSSSFGADGLPMAMGDVEEVSVASTDHKMLQEFRARLLTGLKQYYKGKFVEGTLSSDAYKILLFCCDSSHHHHEHPVDLWELAKKEISFGGITQAENVVANKMRKWEIAAKNGKLGKIGGWLVPPLLFLPLLGLSAHLDTIRLVSLETAVELWISLTTSLQTQWLEYSGLYGAMLLDEVQESADGAWGHIVERRIEMPETFQAIQTYRASVSLLSQQKAFILEMSEGGMIEDKESKSIVEIINKRFQTVCKAGPQHQRQSVKAILLGTSFLRGINPKVVDWIRRNCTMKSHKAGECIWEHEHTKDDSSSACVFIVISGVVRMMMQIEDDLVPMYLGSGGVGGVINVVLQDYVPGVSMVAAYAEGNSFGRGPVVLRLPKELFTAMRHYSRDEGLRSYQHLELNLHRTAASNVLDLLRGMVTQQLGTFIRDTMISYLLSEMSHLAKRQRLRTLLREGVHALGLDGDAGVGNQLDWMAELLKMPDDEACALIEDGEIAELEMDEEGYGYLYPWHELLFKAVAAATNSVYDTIRAAVKESVMVVIPPGVSVFQSSTMVLIQGSLLSEEDRMPIIKGESNLLGQPLETLRECSQDTPAGPSFISVGPPVSITQAPDPSSRVSKNASTLMVSSVNPEHQAPSAMVWTSDYFDSEVTVAPVEITAGPKGATLIVWGADAELMAAPKATFTGPDMPSQL